MAIELSEQWNDTAIKGVVFDMDGVLVDTSPCHAAAYEQLWHQLKIEGPDYDRIAGRSTKAVIAEYAGHLSADEQANAVSVKQAIALKILAKTDVGFVDVRAALERLKRANIPMAIATSASKGSADLVLERLAIRDYFEAVITSEDVEKSKPAPDLFLEAIRKIGVDASGVLILEDSISGIKAALASEAYAVTVRQADTLTDQLKVHSRYLGHFDTVESVVIAVEQTSKSFRSQQNNQTSESV